MSPEEQAVIDFGKKVDLLMEHKTFQEVIMRSYIDDQALSLGKAFNQSEGVIDALKAISHLNQWLQTKLEDAKKIQLQGK